MTKYKKEKIRKKEIFRIVSNVSSGSFQCAGNELVESSDEHSLTFSSLLTAPERAYVHTVAGNHKLYHWSSSKPRRITVGRQCPPSMLSDDEEEIPYLPRVNTRRYRHNFDAMHPRADLVEQLAKEIPPPTPLGTTSNHEEKKLVCTVEELERAANNFKVEVGVDLELHSEHSFDGICCLIQISTRTCDYIIDALLLHDHINRVLGPVFSDPNVLKVFHAAEGSDIPALHRDFDIFVVNVFDTQRAASCLMGRTRLGLIHVLRRFEIVDSSRSDEHARLKESYQTCNWLTRPLTDDQVEYAALDSRYLLRLKDALLDALARPLFVLREDGRVVRDDDDDFDQELDWGDDDVAEYAVEEGGEEYFLDAEEDEEATSLRQAWALSQRTSLKLWRPRHDPSIGFEYDKCFKRERHKLTQTQKLLFKMLFVWRDNLARSLDRSPHLVLPNQCLVAIVKHAPTSTEQLAITYFPLPKAVRERASEIIDIVVTTIPPLEENGHSQNSKPRLDELFVLADMYLSTARTTANDAH